MWAFFVFACLGFASADPSVSPILNSPTLHTLSQASLDNDVIGEPRITCQSDAITVNIATTNPFAGRLYVEGESEKALCSQNSGSTDFTVKFGDCNMRRQRTLNPRGVTYSFTVVVSFHPLFVTGKDKAFHVRCFFTEAVKAVESVLDVARLMTTQTLSRDFSLPRCNYELRHGFNGQPLRFASVGDQVTHVFQCDPLVGLVYGVLVHSCYVDDGHGNRFSLIDERGCAVDRFLLNDLSYDSQVISAHVDSHVFKYADRVQLFFTCTVQLCFKDDGGCDGITPPQCGRPPLTALPSLNIPPGLHRRPLPPTHLKFLPKEFPKPKSVTFPGGRTPESTAERVFLKEHPNGNLDEFPGLPPAPNLNRKPESSNTPFGSAGYELSPFGGLFKDSPLSNANETTFLDTEFPAENTTETDSEQTRQARAALKQMESDVSVELMVMPLKEALLQPPEPSVDSFSKTCFSKITIVALIVGAISTMFLTVVCTAFCLAQKFYRHRRMTKH